MEAVIVKEKNICALKNLICIHKYFMHVYIYMYNTNILSAYKTNV